MIEMAFSMKVIEDTATQMLNNLSLTLLVKVHGAFQETGEQMKNYAYERCPVDTGYLRSTIFFTMTEQLNYEFGASAEYALFVEMGTWKMAAQPFIRPAFEAYTATILDAIVKAVMEACRG